MKRPAWSLISKERRAAVLAGTIVLQAICALFFIGDVVADFRHSQGSGGVHFSVETVAAVALLGGVVVLMVELRRLLTRMDEMDTGLRAASGQMAEVMNGFFQSWNLTGAERDVAIMILKGLDNETIAQVRNTAPGTKSAADDLPAR